MKRTKLCNRILPSYTLAEELLNSISHGIGILLGIAAWILCMVKSYGNIGAFVGSFVYGLSMIILYTASTLYHSLRPGTAKKVFQIIDHCTIYVLIAGTYTPILLTAFVPVSPVIGWGLFGVQWGISILAITLNAVDLKRFRVFSYAAYVVLGWAIVFVAPAALKAVSASGLLYLLLGGISYTVGAIFFAIGKKRRWLHGVFHIFVILGSILQFIAIYEYIL